MPIQKIVTLYQYDELPTDEAREKAREWYRNASQDDTYWSEAVTDRFVTICEAIGIDLDNMRGTKRHAIYWSGFWSQGDGASFAGSYRAKPDAGEAIRAITNDEGEDEPRRIADALADLSKRFPELYASIKQSGHYVHDMTMAVDVEVGEDEEGNPLDAAAPLDEQVTELFRDLARWLYRELESAYEWVNSDGTVTENIQANEYTFTEDGKRED